MIKLMKNKLYFFLIVFLWTGLMTSCRKSVSVIDLSGQWQVVLEDEHFGGQTFAIQLPGTTDAAQIGYADTLPDVLEKPQLLRLTRNYRYVGKARYTRQFVVPEAWADRPLELLLERVLWTSQVSVDGQRVDTIQNSLVTPHRHQLPALTAGEHTIEIEIDNSKQLDISVDDLCHSYTDATQVMWNGVLGRMELKPLAAARVDRVEVYPDVEAQTAELVVWIDADDASVQPSLSVRVFNESEEFERECRLQAHAGENRLTVDMQGARLWSEFTPVVYQVRVVCQQGEETAASETTFGMRQIRSEAGKICINGHPVFLRGTLECCIFPMTGTPPTDEAGWEKVIGTAREWGLNHLRFHSWCPPDAAFRVADRLGFYLSVELPVWSLRVGEDPAVKAFMEEEMEHILRQYGNHPSLCMISNGNELQYDFDFLNALTAKAKARDNRHLYITTSFTFEPGHGGKNEPEDDYYVTQWTDSGWVRGQGVFDAEVPSFDKNYNAAMGCLSVPLISHEIGQYAVYPDLKEIAKYTGTLTPHNFRAVRRDLEQKGLLDRAEDYLQASGRLAAILYKEECERAMKTSGLSGYQLLGLQDFPGQGTALVGLVNAFWESKGLVEPAWFRQFCAPVVPLANFAKAVWQNDEVLPVTVQIANYTEQSLQKMQLGWQLLHRDGTVYREGRLEVNDAKAGDVSEISRLEIPLNELTQAEQLTLQLVLEETDYRNAWSVWVYPHDYQPEAGEVVLTDDVNEAITSLAACRKVLLSPRLGSVNGLEGKFLPVFWSPVHFPKQAGTMGLLCDPKHPAFAQFPTEPFGNWQWWRLEKRSTVMVLDSLPGVTPIIEAVDNFVNNRRLATVFEARCGNGRLLFSAMDLLSEGADTPEVRQLRGSLLQYMHTDAFDPQGEVSAAQLQHLLKADVKVVRTDATSIY